LAQVFMDMIQTTAVPTQKQLVYRLPPVRMLIFQFLLAVQAVTHGLTLLRLVHLQPM